MIIATVKMSHHWNPLLQAEFKLTPLYEETTNILKPPFNAAGREFLLREIREAKILCEVKGTSECWCSKNNGKLFFVDLAHLPTRAAVGDAA